MRNYRIGVFPEFDSPRFASSQDEAVSLGAWPGQLREADVAFGGRFGLGRMAISTHLPVKIDLALQLREAGGCSRPVGLNEDDDLDALA